MITCRVINKNESSDGQERVRQNRWSARLTPLADDAADLLPQAPAH